MTESETPKDPSTDKVVRPDTQTLDSSSETVSVEIAGHVTVEEQMIDGMKTLTEQLATLTKIVVAMKESHDKWVRAGKF